VPPGPVLFLALEDTRRRLQARMRMLQGALGWDPDTLHLRTSWPRADQGGLYHLAEWLAATRGRPAGGDRHPGPVPQAGQGGGERYAEDYEALGEIKQLVDLYGCRQGRPPHPEAAGRGPVRRAVRDPGVSGAADGLMVLDRKRGAAEGRLFVTGRDVPEAPSR
jgi:hypothetical protein